MKRNLVKILAVLGCLALSAGFAACGGKDNSGNTDDSTAISSGIENERPAYSTDLAYIISEDNSYYSVIGRGLCADRDIVIPAMHNGLPVKEICENAFYNCDLIRSIVIPDSITSIGDYAFSGCGNLTYNEKDNLRYLGNENNLYLYLVDTTSTDITLAKIDENCKWIGNSAFEDCDSLTEIVIPDSVTSIGDDAFAHCDNLTEIVIPDSVTSIGYSAFDFCVNLTEIVIPDSVTSIGNYAFSWCENLTNITVEENNTAYKSIDGHLYSKDGKTLIQYAVGKTATLFTIPDGVTSIAWYAFRGCSSLTEIVIPDSVTSIGGSAFSNCNSLTEIVIPNSVTSIGYETFYNCYNLTEIVIPDSVTSIDERAFFWCKNLTIYCEAESEPSGWHYLWNCSCPVVWGYKGE